MVLERAGEALADESEFREISLREECLSAALLHANSGARVEARWDGTQFWMAYRTPDRWESESIERELLHRRESLSELLKDELADLNFHLGSQALPEEHFRDASRMYVFRIGVVPTLLVRSTSPSSGPSPSDSALMASGPVLALQASPEPAGAEPGEVLAIFLRALQRAVDDLNGASRI